MMDLNHRVKVFVYRFSGRELQYLMLKHPPQTEGFWGPVYGPIQPWENLERAVLREVREETGLVEPWSLLDLKSPDRFQVGDFDLVEWVYGYQAPGSDPPSIRLGPELEGFRWEPFNLAYESMEMEANRKSMVRLHTLLATS